MLAVITTYYDCFDGDGRRAANAGEFAQHVRHSIRAPLYVAWSAIVRPDALLSHSTSAIEYRRPPDAAPWQKERLLNLLVQTLPPDIDAIAWLDADVLLNGIDAATIARALEVFPVCQLWQYAQLLDADRRPIQWPGGQPVAQSVAAATFGAPLPDLSPSQAHCGYAWAMRRETWTQIGGLYERDLSGTGDAKMAAAWIGATCQDNPYLSPIWCPPMLVEDFGRWAACAQSVTRRRIGYLPITLRHLWHGSQRSRRYGRRMRRLVRNNFDPCRHLVASDGELLRWSGSAPAVLRNVSGQQPERSADS